jgi:CheY-like chemotaxis protein
VSQLERILHVENDPIDVANLQRALARLDTTIPVTTARNGKEALERLHASGQEELPPTLLLLDIGMPIMGGLEFLEALKNEEALRSIPVVVLTASLREEERQRAYDLGVAGYFFKPLRFGAFVTVVDSILRYWRRSAFP